MNSPWFNRLIDALAFIAGALLCLLVVLISVDVIARSSRLLSLPWTLDIAEYALYIMTFFGAPWVLREQGHIAIEVFVERLPRTGQAIAALIVNSTGVLVCLALLIFSLRQLWRSFNSGNLVYETFVYAEWYQYAIPPPIFLILMLLFVQRLIDKSSATRDTTRGL